MVFDFIDQTRDGTQKRTGLSSSKLTQAQPIGMWKSLPVTKGDPPSASISEAVLVLVYSESVRFPSTTASV